MEVDRGGTWVEVAGQLLKARYLVATLPACNAYFAKLYPVERLECLLDGILSAFCYFGGLTARVVLDNTSARGARGLRGPERVEERRFHAFRGGGELALDVDFCAPRKGWEKGSVEGGVHYVRENCLRPRISGASWEAINAQVLRVLEADLGSRLLPDGRTCAAALLEEQSLLRSLPVYLPDTSRTMPRVVDKFGHVLIDGVRYSVPIEHAYQAALVHLFHDRVEAEVAGVRVATHTRSFRPGRNVLDVRHILGLLGRKHRASGEATAVLDLPPEFEELRRALREHTRHPDREWVEVLKLMLTHAEEDVAAAVAVAIARALPEARDRADAAAQGGDPTALGRAGAAHPGGSCLDRRGTA